MSNNEKPAPRRPISVEITPDEYDHYMREAQRMRAEAMAGIVERWFAGFAGLFAGARKAPIARPTVSGRPALGDAD